MDKDIRRQRGTATAGHQPSRSFDSAQIASHISTMSSSQEEMQNDIDQSAVIVRDHVEILNTLVRGPWRHDPFDVYGNLNCPRATFLLSHCKYILFYPLYNLWCTFTELQKLDNSILNTVWVSGKKLVSFQTSKPGLLHATFLFTASHLRTLSNSNDYEKDILHHKGMNVSIFGLGKY